MIATEHDSLHHHLIHCRGPVPFTTLWAECQILSRLGQVWPPATQDQLRRELRALAQHGLATTWTTEEEGEAVEWWRGECRTAEPAASQGTLFG